MNFSILRYFKIKKILIGCCKAKIQNLLRAEQLKSSKTDEKAAEAEERVSELEIEVA